MLRQWEARERDLGAPKVGRPPQFHEEVTSLKAHSVLLRHLIYKWNAHQQAFQVGPSQWYTPTQEDIYFITELLRKGVDFPSFPEVLVGCVARSQLVYSQRNIGADVLSPSEFQVLGGQLRIGAFGRQAVQCLSLLISTISHNTSDGQHISFQLLYYVYSLVQEP